VPTALRGAFYAIASVLLLVAAVAISDGTLTLIAITGGLILLGKVLLAAAYRPIPRTKETWGPSVGIIIPCYNEDPDALLRCTISCLDQDHWYATHVWLIDDGSTDPNTLAMVDYIEAELGSLIYVLRTQNAGKRHAQAHAFRAGANYINLWVTVDSDTELRSNAVVELIAPFVDKNVYAVTGQVKAWNQSSNVITRLLGVRYASAFLWERAAYSYLGNVLCCCGSLSAYRNSMIQERLDDYVNQKFLGVSVPYGDDRRLTNYCLADGKKVLFQSTAIASTLVPERFTHLLRQQIRWHRSFFRETLWILRHGKWNTWAPWLSAIEFLSWSVLSFGLVGLLVTNTQVLAAGTILIYAVQACLIAYARSVKFIGSSDASLRSQIGDFLLAPIYAALHIAVIIPLRLVALFTLRSTSWGTRKEIEVGTN
jgi:hyaluronan synthase